MPHISKAHVVAKSKPAIRIAIVGTVGVPGCYGGFETLADNLVKYHAEMEQGTGMSVYCSSKAYAKPRAPTYKLARLRYMLLQANGVQSILYDILSMLCAVLHGHNRILLLGVSGALGVPLIRLFPWVRIVANIDGIEWKRAKWNRGARLFLRLSEMLAVRFSHKVIADNQAIADYVAAEYGRKAEVIAYGGDHAVSVAAGCAVPALPETYALALCRIEPENNVGVVLEAWSTLNQPLVFVGNWDNSAYGRELKQRYSGRPSIILLDPIYQPPTLRALRDRASLYVHGHSAGGTNPSLVEMMHFAIPVIAWDCRFNRLSTDHQARYFSSAEALVQEVKGLDADAARQIGAQMVKIALDRYVWEQISADYFGLLKD